jgi:hypothetical protein
MMQTAARRMIELCGGALAILTLAAPVQAQQVVVQGSGSGAFEVPGVANGATAFAQCTLDRTAQTISCTARIYNLVDLVAGHVHVGAPGTSGPVVIGIPNLPPHISGTFGLSWTWTTADFNPTSGNAAAGLNSLDDLINSCAAGGCYLNWHTTTSPGGALRVNLCPANRAGNAINSIAVCVQQGQ